MIKNFKLFIGVSIIVLLLTACKKDKSEQPNSVTIASLTTKPITTFNYKSIKSGGVVTSDGGSEIIALGLVWSTRSQPTIADNSSNDGWYTKTEFNSYLEYDFTHNVTYYFRAYAKKDIGIAYGNEVTHYVCMNQPGPTVTDIDGNLYHTVGIGNQVWMVENLKTTRYRDGTDIPNITDNTSWINLTTSGYCDYNNNPLNSNIYGRLYNWHASTNTHNICPAGWHIPTLEEWQTLYVFLGDSAGSKLKEFGTNYWIPSTTPPYEGGTNISGFTALPGGLRNYSDGSFSALRTHGLWWTSSNYDAAQAEGIQMAYFHGGISSSIYPKNSGFSVRCVKD